jgi:hypothetical protein
MYCINIQGKVRECGSVNNTQRKRSGGTPNPTWGDGGRVARRQTEKKISRARKIKVDNV